MSSAASPYAAAVITLVAAFKADTYLGTVMSIFVIDKPLKTSKLCTAKYFTSSVAAWTPRVLFPTASSLKMKKNGVRARIQIMKKGIVTLAIHCINKKLWYLGDQIEMPPTLGITM